ncbi:hypothetical protein PIB30_097938 [Stylosanthes scabra]|uniref:glucan endo-1,3-beta-D-glucosidase n=1 Tax=Stylosanthes scabra TaxID=79078 RepID=A0ABU6QXA5_9FABA|nr:hypothetical protein [Stylosanthes scabra]
MGSYACLVTPRDQPSTCSLFVYGYVDWRFHPFPEDFCQVNVIYLGHSGGLMDAEYLNKLKSIRFLKGDCTGLYGLFKLQGLQTLNALSPFMEKKEKISIDEGLKQVRHIVCHSRMHLLVDAEGVKDKMQNMQTLLYVYADSQLGFLLDNGYFANLTTLGLLISKDEVELVEENLRRLHRLSKLLKLKLDFEIPKRVSLGKIAFPSNLTKISLFYFAGLQFLYDAKLGGIIYNTCSSEDDRFETFSGHHYEFGYFLYGIAVLAKIDPSWGMKYKRHAYSFIADFMNFGAEHRLNSTRLSCFDLYRLHSWSGEIFKVQDSTSESVNAYYSAALMGLVYGDMNLSAMGATLASLEIHAAKMWWHVKEGDNMYSKANKLVGYISASGSRNRTMRHYDVKDCKVALHVLPLFSVSECFFSNVDFVKELVEWTESGYGAGDWWKTGRGLSMHLKESMTIKLH